MKMMLAVLLAVATATSFPTAVESASPPVGATSTDARFGTQPTRDEAIAAAQNVLEAKLKDPASAQVEWGELTAHTYQKTVFSKKVHGHLFLAKVNSKNSFGGYTGFQTWGFFFSAGKLTYAATFDENGFETPVYP